MSLRVVDDAEQLKHMHLKMPLKVNQKLGQYAANFEAGDVG